MYLNLLFQKFVCFCFITILYSALWVWFFIFKKHHINNLKYIRKRFKAIKHKIKGPLIICPNHLTYIDSIILLFAFGTLWDYLVEFRTLSWNFPKIEHIKNNLLYKSICYLGKCIPVNFADQPKLILKKAAFLLSYDEYILLFPEGHRSKTGSVDIDNFTYGVGKLVTEIPTVNVLCVYLRGYSQKNSSNFPKDKERFYCKIKLINIKQFVNEFNINNQNPLRSYRDISRFIINNLHKMEQQYFLSHG